MILSFTLSMPQSASWNGRWSGEGSFYAITKVFRSKEAIKNACKILQKGYYTYSWPDGWTARITVKEVDGKEKRKIDRKSQGFLGYDWMVNTIISHGNPLSTSELKALKEVNDEA